MHYEIVTPPAIYPVTSAEAKEYLRLSGASYEDSMRVVASIAAGSYGGDEETTVAGSSVDIASGPAMVSLDVGSISGGSATVRVQDSADGSSWTTVYTWIVSSAGNERYAYSGVERYLRVVITLPAGVTMSASADVIVSSPVTPEDTLLDSLIAVATAHTETITRRRMITQTARLTADDWPDSPLVPDWLPLQSVSSIVYYDRDGASHTVDPTIYGVDAAQGKIYLRDGKSWPSATLRESGAVEMTLVLGYGNERAAVPEPVRHAILLLISHLYEHRDVVTASNIIPREIPLGYRHLLWPYRNWRVT